MKSFRMPWMPFVPSNPLLFLMPLNPYQTPYLKGLRKAVAICYGIRLPFLVAYYHHTLTGHLRVRTICARSSSELLLAFLDLPILEREFYCNSYSPNETKKSYPKITFSNSSYLILVFSHRRVDSACLVYF